MQVTALQCIECGEQFAADEPRYRCSCTGELDVVYDYSALEGLDWETLRTKPFRHDRYQLFLPELPDQCTVSLGAGGTPLVEARSVGARLGLDNLYFKLESMNPTGSFKDRGTMVELGMALKHGADEVVVASTGNMGASIAAHCARAGIAARIYVPADVQGVKMNQMQAHGATIERVDGDYTVAAERAWQDWEDNGTYLLGDYPYRGEGQKTVGHEIGDQITADSVVLPVGNGTLLHGVWNGFQELLRAGLVDRAPRLVAVQADGCNTVVNALQQGADHVSPVSEVETVAGAIACGNPLDGVHAVRAVQDSGGAGVAVSDESILAAKQLLAEEEGIYAEEAGAAAFAGIKERPDLFESEDTVVCVVTGHGLKT